MPEPAGFPVCPGRVELQFSTSMRGRVLRITTTVVRVVSLLALFFASACVWAAQIDIPGPAGSQTFGQMVVVLPNSNIVVADLTDSGAVYLYSAGGTLISTLTGSSSNDMVGDGGIFVLPSGNFLVASPSWSNGSATSAGAVTWVNGSTGLNAAVSPSNSLVGVATNDMVGSTNNHTITILQNGNYVVASTFWNSGAGAVTWANGHTGISGTISSSNSLIGTTANGHLGTFGIVALSNGNYVVQNPNWANGTASLAGSATWGSGTAGVIGSISSSNSLVGMSAFDQVGTVVTALSNGNYVVGSDVWHNSANLPVGAATWANGATGITGPVTTTNSLIGTQAHDTVGFGITALSNGNYVISNPNWHNSGGLSVGAATWVSGAASSTGTITSVNSLIGSTAGDQVGSSAFALNNGNYVVASPAWSNGTASQAGAATWGNGATGRTGIVSSSNSYVGQTSNDQVGGITFGLQSVIALTNGNYVVVSPFWNNGAAAQAGAVTWGNGASGSSGAVSSANSLVGSSSNDLVGLQSFIDTGGTVALSNGNYVVSSPNWSNGSIAQVGAATWGSGSAGISGTIGAPNSLIGSTASDEVGAAVAALSDGNYVVSSPMWSSTSEPRVGAVTWGSGKQGVTGLVSSGNSLVGSSGSDAVGSVTAESDNNYVIASLAWSGPSGIGAVSLANGRFGITGPIQPFNSVINMSSNDDSSWVFSYDPTLHRVAVGRPADNLVSLLTTDQIFASGFE